MNVPWRFSYFQLVKGPQTIFGLNGQSSVELDHREPRPSISELSVDIVSYFQFVNSPVNSVAVHVFGYG